MRLMDRRLVMIGLGGLGLTACDSGRKPDQPGPLTTRGETIPVTHARYLTLERHPGFVLARLRAPVADQSGGQAREQSALVVIAPRDGPDPVLQGELGAATIVRTPVRRVAVNASPDEVFLTQLGMTDSLVAVGGRVSYDDVVRQAVIDGRIGQIGYNWHAPPNLDVLVAARPEVFLMRLSDLSHTPALDRARSLGVTVVPTFAEDEPTYLGRAEWIRLHGLLTGREAEADRLFASIVTEVERLKALAATRSPTPVLWAYPNGGDRWVATVRGSEGAYLTDAGGRNLLARAEDPMKYSSETLSTEAILPVAPRAQVWILGDIHAVPPRSTSVEAASPAFAGGRLFANTGRTNAAADAYDWYQTAVVRPDWVLADFVKALHPDLVDEPFRFLKPLDRGQYL